MPSSPTIPFIGGPLISSEDGYMLYGGGNAFKQAYSGGALQDVFYDESIGALIVGNSPSAFAGIPSCFNATSYPGYMAQNACGFFSRYGSGFDAEILNLFGDDMYIGPFYDPIGGNAGTFMIYRSGFGNEGDGTFFVNTFQEFIFNETDANARGKNGAAFVFNGRIGNPSEPTAKFNALQGSALVHDVNTNTAAAGVVNEALSQDGVNTTNATTTTLMQVATASSTTIAIEVIVVAKRTGGSAGTAGDSARYKLSALFRNVAGVVTQVGTTTVTADESVAAYDCILDISGTLIRVRVTGVLNTNIRWHATMRRYTL